MDPTGSSTISSQILQGEVSGIAIVILMQILSESPRGTSPEIPQEISLRVLPKILPTIVVLRKIYPEFAPRNPWELQLYYFLRNHYVFFFLKLS